MGQVLSGSFVDVIFFFKNANMQVPSREAWTGVSNQKQIS